MDWNRGLQLIGQIGVLAVLGTLACLGHNDQVTSGLLAVCGAIAGVGLFQAVKKS